MMSQKAAIGGFFTFFLLCINASADSKIGSRQASPTNEVRAISREAVFPTPDNGSPSEVHILPYGPKEDVDPNGKEEVKLNFKGIAPLIATKDGKELVELRDKDNNHYKIVKVKSTSKASSKPATY